ncbi:DUF2513 domain-containing protein [Streptobacillus moniliformis]|uniref:DUF2513 domain-containing protein n=1 Tax=Streptobacillus moniliformis TaxID=34105 RepID=UPI0007E4CD31|nr:DUF2513 domain-containing protein [Streptobacillus moniliformis]
MKLNLDLVRKILLYIEENGNDERGINVEIKGYTRLEIDYHICVLSEGNYLLLYEDKTPKRRTMKGHSYIENIRCKYIWEELKKYVELKGILTTSLDIIKDYGNKFIKDKLEL